METARKLELLKDLSEELLADGKITAEQFKQAEDDQKPHETWADVLIRKKLLSEETFLFYLEKHGVGIVDPSETLIDPSVAETIPENHARQYRFIPLYEIKGKLTIATPDLDNIPALDYLKHKHKKDPLALYCTQSNLEAAWMKLYHGEKYEMENLHDALKGFEEEGIGEEIQQEKLFEDAQELQELQSLVSEAPVVRMVNMLLAQSIIKGASDIHVCPQENELIVRHRVDGILLHLTTLPKKLERVVISRLKIMSGMDIAERRVPQDGRFKVKLRGRYVDVRVSSFPTQFGENMVLRLLLRAAAMVKLDELKFTSTLLKKWRYLLNTTAKILLVTGPTGSGKTTTLYASLNEVNDPKVNIMTIEDPIEYNLPLIRQSQVNPKIGVTFAAGLRSILRQDPDIIMVGEIRDEETARIAIQAALTGHLVLSTLHTNSAIGAISRLTDMGIEPFLVAASVKAVMGQRLVRLICKGCKTKYEITDDDLARFEREQLDAVTQAYVGTGCDQCNGTGYKGRMLLTELLEINREIRQMVIKGESEDEILRVAFNAGMRTLRQDGMAKVMGGLTTISEVYRVTPEEFE
jgi:type IV pilus assembly protein PilB